MLFMGKPQVYANAPLFGLETASHNGRMFALLLDQYTESLTNSLYAVESWGKVVVLLITAPVWYPILKSMKHEVGEMLAPEGGLYATAKPRPSAPRAPGDDPFLNIPYARYRSQQKRGARASTSRASSGSNQTITPAKRANAQASRRGLSGGSGAARARARKF